MADETIEKMVEDMQVRSIGQAESGDPKLGPLKHLPGTWSNKGKLGDLDFAGFGWNLIALPFEPAPFNYRVLMNQYNENLVFKTADKGVPNRGLDGSDNPVSGDQTIAALDYEQTIEQIAADDSPSSDLEGASPKGIHHEPGLFLFMLNKRSQFLDIARLGTIPHGDSVLAMGRSRQSEGRPHIPGFDALPIGLRPGADIDAAPPPGVPDYLAPYRHFVQSPFRGTVPEGVPFPGFEPKDVVNLLRINPVLPKVVRSTVLDFDTEFATGGIVNIPFVVAQANATKMRSIFWIHELDEEDQYGGPALALQYVQIVMLEFFERGDGVPGLIEWPHVSINTMLRVSKEPMTFDQMLTM